jgi:phage repressor protein C with HTH and peptisase S24 domain
MFTADKLLEIRRFLGLNQSDFSRKIGYSREVVSKVENGKMDASKWFVEAVLKLQNDYQFHNIGGDVKILGKISQSTSKKSSQSYFEHRRGQKNLTSQLLVPLVGIKAQAGYVRGYEQTDFLETLDKYSLPPGVNSKGLEWSYFEVDGDSMEPTLTAGDVLLTSMLAHEDWNDIKNFCVYVILTNEQLLVKRVYRKNENQWILLSDNEESYPQVLLDISNIKQVWTCRRHIRSKVPQPKEFKITA